MRDKKSIQDIVFNNPRADRKSPLLVMTMLETECSTTVGRTLSRGFVMLITRIRRKKKIEKLASDDSHWSGLQ